jgi:hypothetical protein
MKKSLFALLFVLLSFTSYYAHADEDVCFDMLSEHIQIINTSENLLKTLGEKSKDITAFQIIEMQKSMTKRFASLKKLLASYKDDDNVAAKCTPKVLASAVAIYDFSRAGKSIFDNKILRRVFLGFSDSPLYQLMDYIDNYKYYTSNRFIKKTQAEIEIQKVILPDDVTIHKSHLGFDPNLYAISDAAVDGTTSVVAAAARIWGFISDHLKWREGRIKDNQEAISILRRSLKPLDMIFEKRDFTLSNYTIPGHWGHVGVWLGTKDELIALGIWDKPYFVPFKEFVEAGQNIMEIRKDGLNFKSIETFINLDEIAVTRIKNIAEDRADEVYEGLSEQMGKDYDFRFDARTADKITCAELISFTYGDIKWPQTKTLFQISLRPDDLAVMSLEMSSIEEFVLYFKGIKEKDGGGFQNLGFDKWAKLFKVKKHLPNEEIQLIDDKKIMLTNEQKEKEKEKEIKEAEEKRSLNEQPIIFNNIYTGA